MLEGLMAEMEVTTRYKKSLKSFSGSGEPGNPSGSGSGLKIGEITLSNWVLSPGNVSGDQTWF